MLRPAIQADRLTKRYEGVTAVNGLSFRVEPGMIYGLVGPDGAGKTTALRCLVGAIGFDSGRLTVAGYDTASQAELVRQSVGYMPQRFSLYTDLTMLENLAFFSDIYRIPPTERTERINSLLHFSRLGGHENKTAGQLSGGMRQKLALMAALIHQPRVLILDEPSTGVDPVSRGEFWKLLLKLRESGTAILVTTPYMDEAAKCSRIGLMASGTLLKEGSPGELLEAFPFRVLEIRASPLFRAKTALSSAPGVRTAVIHGEAIHVIVADVAAGERSVRAVLAAGSFELSEITRAEPSLEDVFIAELSARPPEAGGLEGGGPRAGRH